MADDTFTIPAQFDMGGVYLGDFSSDLNVEKLDKSSALLATHFAIIVELIDHLKMSDALNEDGFNELHPTREQLQSVKPRSITRYAFQPRDARFLCMSLIHTLADGGDRVAAVLQEKLAEILEEMKGQE